MKSNFLCNLNNHQDKDSLLLFNKIDMCIFLFEMSLLILNLNICISFLIYLPVPRVQFIFI